MKGHTDSDSTAVRNLDQIADGEGVAVEVFEGEESVEGALEMTDRDGVGSETGRSADEKQGGDAELGEDWGGSWKRVGRTLMLLSTWW